MSLFNWSKSKEEKLFEILIYAPVDLAGARKKVGELLSKGVDVNAVNEDKITPLFKALDLKGVDGLEIVKMLLDAGARIDIQDAVGRTPIYHAAWHCTFHIIELLLKRGSNIHVPTYGGETCLHSAASGGNSQGLQILINAGAEVNARDLEQKTPLIMAVLNGHAQSVHVLLLNGADVNAEIPDTALLGQGYAVGNYFTALGFAVRRGNARDLESAEILRSNGGV